jgi:hypothetical protein
MAPWYKYLFRKNPNRFADEIWAAHNSNIGFEVRWAKRMMRICDKMKLNKIEQVQIFHIGLEYYHKRAELNFQLPHLPEILEREVKIIRVQRDLAWREILEYRFEDFKETYSY